MKFKVDYRTIICSLVFFLLAVHANAQKVTLHVKDMPLVDVMNKVKKQTGYSFFYNSNLIELSNNVTVDFDKEDLNNALYKIFGTQNTVFNYQISNKTIVLNTGIKKENGFNYEILQYPQNSLIIKGTIIDVFKTKLPGVTIVNTSLNYTKNNIALTDKNGDFVIGGKIGDSLIIYSPEILTTTAVFKGEKDFSIVADLSQNMLERVTIQTVTEKKKDPTRFVDLTNRLYMNLGQVLQGTIPGLSMQMINTSTNVVKKLRVYSGQRWNIMTPEEFLRYGDPHAQEIINGFITGNLSRYIYFQDGSTEKIYAEMESQVSSAMVPQIRGTNTFSSGLNGMLVVIDGFPQDGFPAEYPMSNVESIEVIKDPKELIKWGEKANGGIILIKTKGAKTVKPTINLNASFYLTPAPRFNREKLKLANSVDYLDYYKELYDKSIVRGPEAQASTLTPNMSFLNPALKLLASKNYGVISENEFNNSWDSLNKLDNQSQMKFLQQNAFNNIYNLSVMGGSKHYKYNFIGMYNGTKSNAIDNYSKSYGLSSTNDFLLLKDKLHITWFSNLTYTKTRAGVQIDPINGLPPYQMIFDNQGNYIYDYSNTISSEDNDYLKSLGYKEFGTNILQDAKETQNISKNLLLRSRLNWDWNLMDDLKWSSSIYYNRTNNINSSDYGENSTYTRGILNTYGYYNNNKLVFYVPNGNIFIQSKQKIDEINVRSALSYNHAFGRHYIGASIGSGGSVYNSLSPSSNTIYGYSSSRKRGLPITLPSGNYEDGIFNYNLLLRSGGYVYPYSLLNKAGGDSTKTRSLNWNGSFSYSFADYISVSLNYNASYSPNYGYIPPYSKISTYNGDLTLRPFVNTSSNLLKNISFSTGISDTKMPSLPVMYTTSRYLQAVWNNYAIVINNQNPTQQVGQRSKNIYQKINLSFLNKTLNIFIGNNTQKIGNIARLINSKTTYDSSSSLNYINGGLNGLLFDSSLSISAEYSKSPEGQEQVNGTLSFNLLKTFHINNKSISSLQLDMQLENVSPMQGLGIQMSTNVSSGSGFGLATNGVLNSLPPKNTNYELRAKVGFNEDNTLIDLRYYNRTTAGISSTIPLYTDPATGLTAQSAFSSIQNKGLEFFVKFNVFKTRKTSYNVTFNGAYNINLAKNVPFTRFSVSSSYSTAYRNNYSINNIWSYRWAGLNDQGLPQIYDNKGQIVSDPDSATLASSMVYSGVSKAPWNGGFIQEFTFGDFFARSTMVLNFGGVMRRHIPTPNNSGDNSVFIKDRWRKPGDEKFTDIPGVVNGNTNMINFLSQYSTNSIISANFVRLQEVMLGCYLSKKILSFLHIKSGYLTIQAQNLALWTKNKYHMDPSTVSSDGRLSLPVPKMYACSLNVNF